MVTCNCNENKLTELKQFIAEHKSDQYSESYLIAVLHRAQEIYGYLPEEIMNVVSQEMAIPTSHIWGVATFYHYFNLTPPGKYVVSICLGTACYVKGAGEVLEAIKKELAIEVGQITKDGIFSLQPARCLGACGLAPVVMVNEKIYGELNDEKVVALLRDIRKKDSEGTNA